MNKLLCSLLFILTAGICNAQNFTGQWKGSFVDKSISASSWGGNTCDYVLDLDISGKNVSGYSYTYFADGGKRYYTICKLKGFFDKKRKYVEVEETERTKTNVPVRISNSFQVHKLTWRKDGDNEVLEGKWIPAPGQDNMNTGFGTTLLTKRSLREIAPLAKTQPLKPAPATNYARSAPKPNTGTPLVSTQRRPVTKPPVKPPVTTPAQTTPKTPADAIVKTPVTVPKPDDTPATAPGITFTKEPPTDAPAFERRNNTVLETVSVENPVVKIELYDNGEVDGDSVSLFYNGKVLLAHKRLSEKAISLNITVDDDGVNELVMYADNLGSIPPNTALMIVRDGNKRYEVRITSDLKKSGTIRFVHKQSSP